MPPKPTKSVQRSPQRRVFTEAFPCPNPAFTIQKKVQATLASLKEMSTEHDLENMPRFGIATSRAFGASFANIRVLAKCLSTGLEHPRLAWGTG